MAGDSSGRQIGSWEREDDGSGFFGLVIVVLLFGVRVSFFMLYPWEGAQRQKCGDIYGILQFTYTFRVVPRGTNSWHLEEWIARGKNNTNDIY